MRRREFFAVLGGAAAAWPMAARAQRPGKLWRIGFLRAAPPPDATMAALRRGLAEFGYLEGQQYVLVGSWGDGRLDRLPALASALLAQGVDIVVTDGSQPARAAKVVTSSVPIVMSGGLDPVRSGLTVSLSRPDGNVTGFTTQVIETTGKVFEIANELIPNLVRLTVLNPIGGGIPFREIEAASAKALKFDLKYTFFRDFGAESIDAAIRQAVAEGAQAAIVRGSPFMSTPQRRLVTQSATLRRLPAIYETREYVDFGGLLSYGTDFADLFRRAASYIDRILRGAKPADLPFEQANKFELVINLKTAKALGLIVPPTLIGRADEVID